MARERMNARERFHATFEYGSPDRVFLMSQWIFGDTHTRWLREGLPWDRHFNDYFGYDRMEMVPVNTGFWPPLETRVVEQTAQWQVVEDELGGLTKHWSDREIGMSQWLRYPIRGREQWEAAKKRLDPSAPNRYPQYWDDLKRCYQGRDYPLGIHLGSYYGWIRNWVGMEHLALWYFDQPDLVHEITEYIADFMLRVTARALEEIPDLDFAQVWEDMAMKTGPLISPDLFRRFMSPRLKRVTDAAHQAGIRLIMVDCDGRVDKLIPLWLEAGVNLVYPLEVASDCNPIAYRQQYGRDLRMIGGIDKRALRDGRSKVDIEREVERITPLIRDGGYSPFVDHAVPPDVPFEHFDYYMRLVREACTLG